MATKMLSRPKISHINIKTCLQSLSNNNFPLYYKTICSIVGKHFDATVKVHVYANQEM